MHQRSKSIKTISIKIVLVSSLILALIAGVKAADPSKTASFVHPGMLHSIGDLDRIKKNVQDRVEPWAGAWDALKNNPFLKNDFEPMPLDIVGRGLGSKGQENISWDGTAAYYNALAWYITGNEDYAKKAVEILNAWSYTCKTINGKDAVLCAGIYGYKFVNAAEILRYSYKGWPEKDIVQFKSLMMDVFYPVIKDFSTFANGNWDACCLPTMMSIGIFCDDRTMFDRAVEYYMDGSGDGSLTHYIINEIGQCQESGRDQAHTQAGLGHLAIASEIAYHQGIDLYGMADNRLLKGFEYTAKYNLGGDVPFTPYADRTGKYHAEEISPISRGRFFAIYEMVYNHYQNRMGIEAPFTAQAAARKRPEKGAIDHPGRGTLLFTLPPYKPSDKPPTVPPAMPGPIVAKGMSLAVALRWAPSIHAASYTVKRSTASGGPYRIIAKQVKSPEHADKDVVPGTVYYYTVSASNAAGTSPDTLESGAAAGLPKPWAWQDVGSVKVAGSALFDGRTFTLEAAGTDIRGENDQLGFVYLPMTGDGVITARYVPQTPSQFATMGLMMRESLDPESAHVSLLITPKGSKSVEIPNWSARGITRPSTGAKTLDAGISSNIEAPFATWGRLLEPYWLRLDRSGDTFTASFSPDGRTWTKIGNVDVHLKKEILVGLAACSRLTNISTTVMFDNVIFNTGQ
jgi:hypothetical protein